MSVDLWKRQSDTRRADVVHTLQCKVDYFDQRLKIIEAQAANDVLIRDLKLLKAAYKAAIAVLEDV